MQPGVSTDLVWLQSVLEVAPEELIPDVILAKGVDAALDVLYEARASGQPELRDYLDSLRKADWAFRSKTLSTSSVSYDDFEELSWRGEQRAIAVGKTRRGLILDGIRSATNAIKPTYYVARPVAVKPPLVARRLAEAEAGHSLHGGGSLHRGDRSRG
jgi:hypothetical protein